MCKMAAIWSWLQQCAFVFGRLYFVFVSVFDQIFVIVFVFVFETPKKKMHLHLHLIKCI